MRCGRWHREFALASGPYPVLRLRKSRTDDSLREECNETALSVDRIPGLVTLGLVGPVIWSLQIRTKAFDVENR